MHLPQPVWEAIEARCGSIDRVSVVSGGDINEARKVVIDEISFFLKYSKAPTASRMLPSEAESLRLLSKRTEIDWPAVAEQGEHGGVAWLLLHWIESGSPTRTFWKTFGRQLADMHRLSSEDGFGWPTDNFLGTLPQYNTLKKHWVPFWVSCRIEPQVRMARDAGLLTATDRAAFSRLFEKADRWLEDGEPPALIHGDLWSGNFMATSAERLVLVDPAPAYAHREMDLAMSRLFGGFSNIFYEVYEQAWPLQPGWEDRLPLYQLYYLLAHLNLFGSSYYGSVQSILRRYAG